jgi:REP element-mobilizing transposase RayT
MSEKYKIIDSTYPHFVTFTVIGWIDIFSREQYKEIMTDSLKFCILEKGLILHAWVIMTNHVHLIISSENSKLNALVRDIKKFTSKQIINAIKQNSSESRKVWLLQMFQSNNYNQSLGQEYQFWKKGYHPVCLLTPHMMNQRLNYLHENPVKSGIVWETWHYKYSSAVDYYTNRKGILPVDILD